MKLHIFLIQRLLSFLLLTALFLSSQILVAQNAQLDEYQRLANESLKAGNKNLAANYLNKIAFIYWDTKPGEAIKVFEQSIALNKDVGNDNAVKVLYFNIGMIYSDINSYKAAIKNFDESRRIANKIRNHRDEATALIEIAKIYEILQQYQKAISKALEALDLASGRNDLKQMRSCYGVLAQFYKKAGKSDKYEKAFDSYSALNKKIIDEATKLLEDDAKRREEASDAKVREYSNEVNAKDMELMKQTDSLRQVKDSLAEIGKISKEKQMSIDLLEQEKSLRQLKMKEQEAQLAKASIVRNAIIGGLVLVLVIAIVVYRSFRQKQRTATRLEIQNAEIQQRNAEIKIQRDQIEKKSELLSATLQENKTHNQNIRNSINYALRIQNAMLLGEDALRNFLPESFIFFRPRDVVSGDFYWFKEVESMSKITKSLFNRTDVDTHKPVSKNLLITAVDCTGHGVPGAFMSMIGLNLLNEITNYGIGRASTVLNQLHKAVRRALRQDTTENRDGMDMAVCIVNREAKTMDFAGAKNPLLIIQDDKIATIKGDKHPIGGLQREVKRKFTNHRIDISKPTTVYLFSDGFQDQFGGPKRRKYMKKRFREFLFSIYKKPMQEQQEILQSEFQAWQGKEKQLDDVLVMGFKVDFSDE